MKTTEGILAIGIGAAGIYALGIVSALVFNGPAQRDMGAQSGAPAATPAPATEAAQPAPAAKPATAAAEAGTIAPATGAPDAAHGQKVFAKCAACHTDTSGGANKVGPNLWSVVGRVVGSIEGFAYSSAMKEQSGETWTPERLDQYLTNPKKLVPGTKMAFAGLSNEADRHDVVAYLAGQSNAPIAADALGFGAAAAAPVEAAAPAAAPAPATAAVDPPTDLPLAIDPPVPTPERLAEIDAAVAALKAELPGLDYQRARFHPIHFAPAIEKASDQECLVCHQEILDHKPREQSPAGVGSKDVLAWYQTLDTYEGDQQTFHWRHIESPYASQVMNLSCNFCHKGNDPREESPATEPNAPAFTQVNAATAPFTARKMVNPSTTCLRCHSAMPDPVNIMGLGGPWPEVRADMEDEATPNGCLTCHGELFRTNRHRVTYLKAASIEEAAKAGSDVCFGCHGGRQWYRIAYPYPRHPWPGMDPAVPEWATDRPTESDPQYQMPQAAQ